MLIGPPDLAQRLAAGLGDDRFHVALQGVEHAIGGEEGLFALPPRLQAAEPVPECSQCRVS